MTDNGASDGKSPDFTRMLLCLLSSWAVLSTARLIFDLIGTLWLCVIFDLLQIICCIMGFFGVLQRRRSLIYALMVCIILSVAENVLIFLWYMSIFGNPSQSQALSLGLPYSYSFFLRHTPWCISNFDLLKSQWIQHNCILPYYYIESVQALLHAAVAILIFGFSIAYLCQNSKSSNSSNGSLRHQHNEAYYTEINRDNKASPSSSASQQTVNGYLNSSFTEEEGDIRSRVETSESRMSKDKDGERSSSAETEEYGKRILPLPRTNVSGTSKQKVAKAILPLPHPSAPARTRLFKKVNHKERRSAHMDEENEFQTESSSSSSSRLTSLVSLDLRSPAPVQVQEHYESESSDGSDTIYEKITRGSEYIENIAKNELPPCNSHDSAPSTLAPILIFDENNVASPSRMNPDSGIEYPKPPARMDLWKTASMSSPSSSTTTISSPAGLSAVRQIEAWNRRLNAKKQNQNLKAPDVTSPSTSLQSSSIQQNLSPGIRLLSQRSNDSVSSPQIYGLRSQLEASQTAGICLVTSPTPPVRPLERKPQLMPYKSSFRVESRNDNKSVIGFYHSPSELNLKKEGETCGSSCNKPIIRTMRPSEPAPLLRLSSDYLV